MLSRSVLHVDMDAFFASVEQRDDPALRGRPVLVGGRSERGVVMAASYEARVFGCRSAMPMAQAVRLCPQAIIVPGRFDRYRQASGRVFAILRHYTPLVQPLGLDEAFLDVTGSLRLFEDQEGGARIAREIRRRVRHDVGLTCSVGVAPNKFLAKLGSDLNKPDGLTIIPPDQVDRILCPLPVSAIWGIGPATVRRLERLGLRTVADLRQMPDEFFERKTAGVGTGIRRLIFGQDDRPVTPDCAAKSIGHEQTFGQDIADLDSLRSILLAHVEHVAARLRHAGRQARSITLKLRHGGRYSEFLTLTRRISLPQPSDETRVLWHATRDLLEAYAADSLPPVRLLGVSLGELTGEAAHAQLPMFPDADSQRARRIDAALDAINAKLGRHTIRRAAGGRSPS